MPNKNFTLPCCAAILIWGLAGQASLAHAGFQWVDSDSVDYAAPKSSPVYKGKTAVKKPQAVSPLVSPSLPTTTSSAPEVHPSAPLEAPAFTAGAVASGETISKAQPFLSSAATTEEVVHGFATSVPLALALRQLLPSTHSFSIEQNVDMNTLVSYEGGSPWRETVAVMLEPVGLEYKEQGEVVLVGKKGLLPRPAVPVAMREVPERKEVAMALPVNEPGLKNAGLGSSESPSTVDWTAERGETLRSVLMRWCSRMGVELKWVAEYDYPVEASARFKGRFEDAVRGLLAGFDTARPQPVGSLHANARANQRVLVIQARGNSYSN
ncbi:MAG: toxin co-regulated pilus biosynthesis Q family protein [Alphaproteobacteria bacterium]|nr:toxin co-regulated pilus biosynthesis Q family protein [Alphaproteobacteria bacterium]